MTPFLLAAAIAGVSFFLLLSGPPAPNEEARKALAPSYVNRPALALALALALGLGLTALLEYVLFAFHAPYVLGRIDQFIVIIQSSATKQIFFGAIFGLIFVLWINVAIARSRPFRSRPSEKPDGKSQSGDGKQAEQGQERTDGLLTSDLLLWAVMLLVFMIGVVDFDTIQKFARIGGNVKLPGGVEFSLSGKSDRPADTSVGQIVPPVSVQVAAYGAPNTSSGLDNLMELTEAARRDGLFYALKKGMFQHTGAKENNDPGCSRESEKEVKILCSIGSRVKSSYQVYGVIGQCLKKYVNLYLDGDGAAQALAPIGSVLNKRLLLYADNINSDSVELTDYPNYQKWSIGAECEPHANQAIKLYLSKGEVIPPYHWNAGAAILAYNHKYAAAINVLNEWLRTNESPNGSDPSSLVDSDLRDIFEVRVRSMISSYIDEWLSHEPNVRTQALLDYHADNLHKAILVLDKIVVGIGSNLKNIRAVGKLSTNDEKLYSEYICKYAHLDDNIQWNKIVIDNLSPESEPYTGPRKLDVWRMTLSYISTLISIKQTWIDVVLSSNGYESLLYEAQIYANEFRAMNMDCMKAVNRHDYSRGENFANMMKAQGLYRYARVTQANALAPAEPDKRRERLQDALAAAREGLALVEKLAQGQRAERRDGSKQITSCRDIYAKEQSKEPSKKGGAGSARPATEECRNDFAFRISGTEEIREAERLSGIIRQLNAELD
ncbi:MAG: hypothetical protein HYS63_01800 [Methylocystis sp.]|nr:hypothetical protein [Methylocystis sp.]